MDTLVINAPAKINLCLYVLGRRLDGYHELAMAMQRVSLYDRLELGIEDGEGIEVLCDGLDLGKEENIAARAVRLFLAETSLQRRVAIKIDKHIPVAAGLGGGSSDAAAVLYGLNKLCGQPVAPERLLELGAELGADVPFFLFGRPAWATGTGTELVALPLLPDVCYLLLNPGFAVSTAGVYQSLQLTKGGELANLPRFSVTTISDLVNALHNDLERVTSEAHPEIREMKEFLLHEGALGALMSGSGASVFGVFADTAAAMAAKDAVSSRAKWRAFVAHPLARDLTV
ncbi:4-(cytidine 5'-diphospho)-2-C-methyl-D-erythritol kinase [Geopsychrobacter electrodiphilus]|uniref:4-(cytidine 5'-diphospho)-2-C-methyl-D-erythritol kinase n=1 Tax=Geopsychrobacter electrodiphilus TaxID=225196 RepID=UPI000364138A|nr:4-(cytidine 5'-diphospho)-2-C-methyl-D-erythritol kinase [Geopsychrobacter electrodiphilus]